ncbi:uncharacterized protein LOC144344182 [Saccoglossus kowalevskii]
MASLNTLKIITRCRLSVCAIAILMLATYSGKNYLFRWENIEPESVWFCNCTVSELCVLGLNVVLRRFGTENHMSYGRVSYYQFGLFHVKMIGRLLENGINLLITESDDVWFSNPVPVLSTWEHPSDMRVSVVNYYGGPEFRAGFLYLNASSAAQRVWKTLGRRLGHRIETFKDNAQWNISEIFAEQVMLSKIANYEDPIRLDYLHRDRFVSGQWYSSKDMQNKTIPIVLQNNYIIGNANKVTRATQWGHWFLRQNTKHCIPSICQRLNI